MSISFLFSRAPFRWAILLAITCLAAPANGAQVTIIPESTTGASARVLFAQMGSSDERIYGDQATILVAPVSLPAVLNAMATSAVDPDDADDTAELTVSLSDSGFTSSFSYELNNLAGTEDVSSGSFMSIQFSVDRPVFYTISGSLSWTGNVDLAGWAEFALTRTLGQAALFSEVQGAASSPMVVGTTGSGQLVGALVAGQSYRLSADPTLIGLPTGLAKNYAGNGTASISFVDALDSDADGVADDGDASGVVGDSPCIGGDQLLCDDNCALLPNFDQADADADGIGDVCEALPPGVPFMGFGGRILLISCAAAVGMLNGRRRRR